MAYVRISELRLFFFFNSTLTSPYKDHDSSPSACVQPSGTISPSKYETPVTLLPINWSWKMMFDVSLQWMK
ncbi:hypothetical protein PDIG_77720 [Penicillium digitatum PHI26]|uniref:Uncharacterized protein n=1 Tax=Penicillium digitatum (strain PHI26 / CECT 20796) TaxID=1170229 RepID=K9FAJ3_PEND2|nr:hypothetical protein PDIG_77720 [Penicillium digitatum PHI26]